MHQFMHNAKYFDHAEGTNSKSEVIQTNITANMEIKEQKLGQHANKINNKMKPLQKNRVSFSFGQCVVFSPSIYGF
jgi:hypothetical protein